MAAPPPLPEAAVGAVDNVGRTLTAKETLEKAVRDGLSGFRLKSGLSEREVREFEKRFGVRVSAENRELLLFASGFFYDPFGEVTFLGDNTFSFPGLSPRGLAVARDGAGNFWVLDVREDSGVWGLVFFVSHDPPVVAVQATNLAQFIRQVLSSGGQDGARELEDVTNNACGRIWDEDPYLIDAVVARRATDPQLSRFAAELPDKYRVADLRTAGAGAGFSWGRNGPDSNVRRFDSELLFAVEPRRQGSFISRILGSKR
jgi:hypothetical protein